MGFTETIIRIDQQCQQQINRYWQNGFLDTLAPVLREPKSWIPLYLFLAIFLPWKFGRTGIYWCLGFIATFGVSDFFSASVLKQQVQRIRPCNDPVFSERVRHIVECGVGYSFPSTHATNHFALALFMAVTLGPRYKWVPWAAVLWAFSVAYAQVYVGVHYPADVLSGGLLGALIGILTGKLFLSKIGLNERVVS
ncbi:MAG: phosphatase PAP2 family protein [Chitinophagaceae bacterium]